MTPPIQLYVDGIRVADGSPGEDSTAPYAIDGLTVTWGRPTTVDQPDASSCSFQLYSHTEWPDPDLFGTTITLGRRVDVDAGPGVRVFTGQITDVAMVTLDDDPTGVLVLSVTCDDVLADLNNRPSASTPWPKESVAARFAHVLDAARIDTPFTIASDLAGVLVRRVDADEGQTSMVTSMLTDIALSVDGVLWSTVDITGEPSLRLESPSQRVPLRRLELVGTVIRIVDVSVAAGALHIDTCTIDLAPLEWRQTMSDLVTGVAVTWYSPDPEDPTQDIGTTVTIVDPGSESPTRPWGVRRMTLDSQLTTAAAAQDVADKILARLSTPAWRLHNVVIDQATRPTIGDVDMVKLLNARTRSGLPIVIHPLPAWSPPASDSFTGYLEGGDIASVGGVWSATLWISLAQGYGGISAKWTDLPADPAWVWSAFDPAISWFDLVGVGGPI